ncbi:MAG: type II secretion system protein GspG [Myxococcota bacterium]
MQPPTRTRAPNAGMTLIEILVVVSLMALIGSAVAMNVMGSTGHATRQTCETDARAIRAAAEAYFLERGVCPARVMALVDEGYVDRASRSLDPWDGEFKLTCDGGDIEVASAGPDRSWGTRDDIRVPGDRRMARAGGRA